MSEDFDPIEIAKRIMIEVHESADHSKEFYSNIMQISGSLVLMSIRLFVDKSQQKKALEFYLHKTQDLLDNTKHILP